MTEHTSRSSQADDPVRRAEETLRRQAEAQIQGKTLESPGPLSAEVMWQVLHELRVHQIELEMQNEELRRTQAALEASRVRYFDLYNLAPVGYCTLNEHGLIVEVNLTAATLLDSTRSALVKQPLSRFILPEDQDIYYRRRQQLLTSGTAQGWEMRLIRPDGTWFWAQVEAMAVQDGECRVVLSDITENKQAAERLQVLYHLSATVNRADALAQIYATALGALVQVLHVDQAAILFLDEAGGLCFQAWHRLSAPYRQQVESRALWRVDESQLEPLLIPNVVEAEPGEFRALTLAEGIQALALIPLVEQGQWLGQFMLAYAQPHPFPAVEIAWAQSVAQHVAYAFQRNQAERRLRQLNATLEQRVEERTAALKERNGELDQFAYITSHDLKAPLRAIRQLTTWITQDAAAVLPAASQTHLVKLQGRVQRMEQMIEDLLVYSRAGRQRYAPEPVALAPLVRAISEFLAPPPGFTIRTEPMPTLLTERVPLETVLRNLIGNAIKHHDRPQVGQVTVAVVDQGPFAEFSVSDNGPGIAPQFHDRIFQVFQTLQPREQVEGSGMGLAIVKKAVESRAGRIIVESQLGQGASFRFTWPKHPLPPQ